MLIEAAALKIAGGILITGGAGLAGVFLSRRDTLRREQLQEMKKALIMLKSEIRFSFSPLSEACESVSFRVVSPVSDIFSICAEGVLSDKSGDIAEIWRRAVNSVSCAAHFLKTDIDAIAAFGRGLGYQDRQMQENAVDLLVSYLDSELSSLERDAPARAKMYRSLGVLGGLLITVILI